MEKESSDVFDLIPENIGGLLRNQGFSSFRPVQEKAIRGGLFDNSNNKLVVSPTGSGKTLVGELLMLDAILNKKKKVIYIVPLKALAGEKFREFNENYGDLFNIRVAVGDLQSETYDLNFDLLLVTSEKLDSLIRNSWSFLDNLGLVIVDEIHLVNDEKRGPTLEVLISIFKMKYKSSRIVGLSATVKNKEEFAKWLDADLIFDDFRPVDLHQLVLNDDELNRYK
jgi:helicase